MKKIKPFQLYKYYQEELKKLVNEKLTHKKYNELIKIEQQLKKCGLL